MKFKGMNFRHSRRTIAITNKPYVEFARPVYEGKKLPKNAFATNYRWPDTGNIVWATPIPLKAHSLTNMAYGKDGRVYLAHDGWVYIASQNEKNRP